MKPSLKSAKHLKVIYTGGTLGMLPGPQGLQATANFTPRLLAALTPAWLDKHQLKLDIEEWDPPLDSSAMQPSHWFQLAARVRQLEERYDGILILQGTDTLAWTASALFWLLPQPKCTLVLTAAQKPLGVPGSDALHNLQSALIAATSPAAPRVYLSFNQTLFDPRSTRKQDSQALQAFASNRPQAPNPLTPDSLNSAAYRHPLSHLPRLTSTELNQLASSFQANIFRLALFPGLAEKPLIQILTASDALILEGYGSGTTPKLTTFFDQVKQQNKLVGLISQCWSGGVKPQYAASQAALDAGVLLLDQSTPENAQTSLTWLLALVQCQHLSPQQLPSLWQQACMFSD